LSGSAIYNAAFVYATHACDVIKKVSEIHPVGPEKYYRIAVEGRCCTL